MLDFHLLQLRFIELLGSIIFLFISCLAAAGQLGVGESYIFYASKDAIVILHGIERSSVGLLGLSV